jgi:hypothetical protein
VNEFDAAVLRAQEAVRTGEAGGLTWPEVAMFLYVEVERLKAQIADIREAQQRTTPAWTYAKVAPTGSTGPLSDRAHTPDCSYIEYGGSCDCGFESAIRESK